MRHYLPFLTVALTALSTVTGAPTASPPAFPPQQTQQYFLRVNAPRTPFHNRHIIHIPTPQSLLGLENFTMHPTTPPLYVLPIQIPGQDTYALRLPSGGDDLSKTPYIAALLTASTEVKTPAAALNTIYVSDPTRKTVERDPAACPLGKECVADGFVISDYGYGGREGDGSESRSVSQNLGRLTYGGFEGHWEAVKNAANSRGWHVYWKPEKDETGEVEKGTVIGIELVAK